MDKAKIIFTLLLLCICCNTAMAQWLEVKNERDERSISIKTKDGVSSARVIVCSALPLTYSSNMADVVDENIGSGIVNGLNTDTIYFYVSQPYKRILTISSEGYPSVTTPISLAPKTTYRCFVYDPSKISDEGSAADNTSQWQYEMAQNFDFGLEGFKVDQIEALSWYEKSAEQGHGLSQLALGRKYAMGGEEFYKDVVKSSRWYMVAAQQNYNDAQYAIGNHYLQGLGVEQDLENAYYWFQQAADRGVDEARYKMAEMLFDGYGSDSDVDRLLEWFRSFAEENVVEAQYVYAKLLLERKNTYDNESIAITYLNKAISMFNTDAMLYFAQRCFNKDLKQYDVIRGMRLFRLVADQGDDTAKDLISKYETMLSKEEVYTYTKYFADQGSIADVAALAHMYHYGTGVDVDYDEAFKCYSRSSAGGAEESFYGIGVCYYYGLGTSQDYAKAYKNLTIASQSGESRAVSALARCYYFGHGVDQDYDKAFELFTNANDGSSSEALNGLGLCYCYGNGIEKNEGKGIELFEEALALDGYDAGLSLGDYYYNIKPTSRNEKAQSYYTTAAEAGNPEAQNKLGLMLFDQGIVREFRKVSKEVTDTIYLAVKTDVIAQATGWFRSSGERGYYKGGYNHAYVLVSTLNDGRIVGTDQGKESVKILRGWAQKGHRDAMITLASYYKDDIGIDLHEAYEWSVKAAEGGSGDKNLDVISKALLGRLEYKEAEGLSQFLDSTTRQIQDQGFVNMKQALSEGAKFVYDQLYDYEMHVTGNKKAAKVWEKEKELVPELQRVEPKYISFKR